jgi:transposase-like protein
MALDQSAIADLLDALRAGGDLDIIREGLALVLQALIEAEAAQQIGAGRYQRSTSRTTHRNGSRSRLLSTKAGDVELKIPSSARARSSQPCWSPAAGSTGPCWRW